MRMRRVAELAAVGAIGARGLAGGTGGEVGGSDGCMHHHAERGWMGALQSPLVEPGTGRDLRNYAPDRPADVRHMRLELDIPDMNVPTLGARQTLSFTPIARELTTLPLNAQQMEIQSVSIPDSAGLGAGQRVTHSYDGKVLSLTFDPPLAAGKEASVQIEYRLNDPADGLTWTPETPAWPGRPAQLHTQGQPETNRFWFPSHDFPNERMTTEMVVTVPQGYLVSSNGREAEPAQTREGRTRFHWLQDKDHVAYLVSLVVGKFDVVDVAGPGAGAGSATPMPVYVPPGKAGMVQGTYGRTPEMVRVFERLLDEPYPWDRYAQLMVWNFGAGGMENTSATTLFDTALLDERALEDDDLDGLISHELAHQWFGDLITCNTWAHIWLNEGWATYCTALWYEARDGAQEGYLRHMHGLMRQIAETDQMAPQGKGERPGMVSSVYKHPWEVFRRVSNPYPKGASTLHMLRRRLGDQVFFRAVGVYVERFKHRTVETDDFRRTLEEVSGQSLEQFFEQWTRRPGTPDLKVKVRWRPERGGLVVSVEQRQRIDADHPAFVFDLPVEAAVEGENEPVRGVVSVEGARHERVIKLAREPSMVLIDPELCVLARVEVDAPTSWLVNQLATTRSIASRLDAAAFLSRGGDDARRAALAQRAAGEDHWSVRAASAKALGKIGAESELCELLDRGVSQPKVRLAVLRALGEAGGPRAMERLAMFAGGSEPSYACRSAALEWLGKRAPRGQTTHLRVFEEALEAESQHDQVRTGALKGLAALGAKEGIAMAAKQTRAGVMNRTRSEAAVTIGKLGNKDKDAAIAALEPLVRDREERPRHAAIEAMIEVEDKRGLEILDGAALAARSPDTRERAQDARAKLAARLQEGDGINAAEEEIDRLKADLKRLEKKIEERQEQGGKEREGDAER